MTSEGERPMVIVTRPRGQESEMIEALARCGVDAWHAPTIEILESSDLPRLRAVIAQIERYSWVVFTSRNAVRFVADAWPAYRPSVQIATVGKSTARSVREVLGVLPNLVPTTEETGAGLLETFRSGGSLEGKKILLPLGDLARDELERGLQSLGAETTRVEAYRTVPYAGPEVEHMRAAVRAGTVSLIVVASPSAARSVSTSLGDDVCGTAVAVIGPVTAQAAHDCGLRVVVQSDEPSSDALVAKILTYLHRDASRE